jgi:hypothetical protein
MSCGIYGARSGGTLKEEKIVSASLAANRTNVGAGTGRGEPVPNMRAKDRSFTSPRLKFTLHFHLLSTGRASQLTGALTSR